MAANLQRYEAHFATTKFPIWPTSKTFVKEFYADPNSPAEVFKRKLFKKDKNVEICWIQENYGIVVLKTTDCPIMHIMQNNTRTPSIF